VRTLVELVKNEVVYSNRFAHIAGLFNEAIKNVSRNGSFSEFYEIVGLSNVLKCNIRSIYPEIQYRPDLNIINSTFEHDQCNASSNTIYIFWTHTQSEIDARNSNAGNWSPNHFVPLLLLPDKSTFQNNLLPPKINFSDTVSSSFFKDFYRKTHACHLQTPTKSTTKNNILTQVRIPQFNLEDDESQPLQESPIVFTITKEILTNRQTKRKDHETENYVNVETEKVENQRKLARERSTARRAAFTPEQAEQQRVLARERSAARRAALTPEQAERERALARERNAARRAALTPEEVEQRRTLTREKSSAWRATLAPEEVEQQRTLTREKTSAWRAALTPTEVEQQRSLTREKTSAWRAALTPTEVEQQRSLTREKTSAWRATLTPTEVEQQQILAAERSMAKRATASPNEAEEQRVLARERIAARRTIYTSEKAKQQQAVAGKKSRPQKITKCKQTGMKRRTSRDVEIEWPKPADIECKTNSLKNFIQHMSMNSLEEGVCGICNVRCYKRDLRRVPLSKIPSIELLKVHDDLCSIIPGIQQTNNLYSNDGCNMDDDSRMANDQHVKKASFTCVNDAIFYERGLHHNFDKRKRSSVHCNICTECWSSLVKEKIPKFAAANKVWMGDVPNELQDLTIPEQRLIAIYRHNSCIVKLHSPFHSTATAQSALKGNCISFPQDVVNIATTLPLELEDLCDSLKIIFVGCRTPERNQLKNILTVRKKKVSEALRWLRQNNPLYRNVKISQSTVDKLPDDDVPECLWTTMQISTNIEAAQNERASYVPDSLINTSELNNTTSVPLTTR
jgi:hypothetical protein